MPLEPTSSLKQYGDFYSVFRCVLSEMLLRRNTLLLAKIGNGYRDFDQSMSE
jgi:hypothetical protein